MSSAIDSLFQLQLRVYTERKLSLPKPLELDFGKIDQLSINKGHQNKVSIVFLVVVRNVGFKQVIHNIVD